MQSLIVIAGEKPIAWLSGDPRSGADPEASPSLIPRSQKLCLRHFQ
jgi:hypothetical protein